MLRWRLADRVSAALTGACLFLVLALAVTLVAWRPRERWAENCATT